MEDGCLYVGLCVCRKLVEGGESLHHNWNTNSKMATHADKIFEKTSNMNKTQKV